MKRCLFLLALSLVACQPLPVSTSPVLREARECAVMGTCIPIRAENQTLRDATIYINGVRVGELSAAGSRTFWVRKASLVEGNCLYAVAVFRLQRLALGDSKQCGESFRLTIGVEGKLWVIPRGAEQP